MTTTGPRDTWRAFRLATGAAIIAVWVTGYALYYAGALKQVPSDVSAAMLVVAGALFASEARKR